MFRSFRVVAAAALLVAPLGVLTTATSASATEFGVVSGTAATTYQTNNTVWKLAYANGAIYAAGDFTSVRPSGAALGTSETARQYMAAFNSSTGALLPFNHTFDVRPTVIAASPDGTRIYAGGSFTKIDGQAVGKLVAFDTATGNLVSTFLPTAANGPIGQVTAITATNSTVYFSGTFTKVGTTTRTRLAAVTASTGALTSWAPTLDVAAYTMSVTSDGTKVYAGGAFNTLNGVADRAVGAIDGTTGASLPFAAASAMPPVTSACSSVVKNSVIAGDSIYFAAEGTGGGCFDGTFAALTADGSLKWKSSCLGATQAVAVIGNYVYKGSHAHDCASYNTTNDPDAFTQVPDRGDARHLLSQSITNGQLGPWYPNTNGGGTNGLGPRTFATDGTNLWVGGEFTTVNNKAQQGLTEFAATPDTPPNKPASPVVVSSGSTSTNVYVQVPLDLDDTDLIVRLYRDSSTTPFAQSAAQHSLFWKEPVIGFQDTGLVSGSKHTYRADAIEVNGSAVSALSPNSNTVTVGAANSAYASAVVADSPSLYWRLGEAGGTVAADTSSNLAAGVYIPDAGTITYGQAGAPAGDSNTAVALNGSWISSGQYAPSPSTFSVETWFKTTTTSGGKIIGFGNEQSTESSNYDKHVYMTNSGQLIFGVYNGATNTIQSPNAYNDGKWHYMVATQGSSGMKLYVDGTKVASNTVTTNQTFNGYWRVGEDELNGWPSQPSSDSFNGTLDEVAVYPTALSQTQVNTHYQAGGGTVINNAPTDSYGKAVYSSAPDSYWRLGESSGTVAADASGNFNTANYGSGVTLATTGAVGGTSDTAVTLNGTSTGIVSATNPSNAPAAFSTELWFKTTTTQGGKIIGFGDSATGTSSSYDKQVYMTNAGQLIFGVYSGSTQTATSPASYNDGNWHYLVATQNSSGMTLYVDGQAVATNPTTTNQSFTGYWRLGGDNLGSWPSQPTSSYFAGSIDEAAIYSTPLTAANVTAHWQAAGH